MNSKNKKTVTLSILTILFLVALLAFLKKAHVGVYYAY